MEGGCVKGGGRGGGGGQNPQENKQMQLSNWYREIHQIHCPAR